MAFFYIIFEMRALKTIVILAILIGLPAGSWYFLKFGYNWRKDKIELLKPKGHFLKDLAWSEEEKSELYAAMFFKTNIVQIGGEIGDDQEKIIDQFRKAPTFQWIVLLESDQIAPKVSTKDVKKYINVQSIFDNNSEYASAKYMIVDTAFQIRQIYSTGSEEELGQLVEDYSLSIPKQKDKDIAIRNK